MKENEMIIEVMKKYKLQEPILDKDQDKILKSKKKALRSILQEDSSSLVFQFAFNLYYWLRNQGCSIPLRKCVRFAYVSSFSFAIVFVLGMSLFLKDHIFQSIESHRYMTQGHVIDTSGKILIRTQGKINNTINIKDIIETNSIITTGEHSEISIQLARIGTIRLMPETTASFRYLNEEKKIIEVNLRYGALYSNIITKFGGIYRVKTPTCLAIAHGTQYLTIYRNNTTEVRLLEGRIGLMPLPDQKQETSLTENHSAIITAQQKIAIKPLTTIAKLELKKTSLYAYIENIETKTVSELDSIRKEIKIREATLTSQIELEKRQQQALLDLAPLDRLRKIGKPLAMFHLRDNTRIAGYVKSQTESHILLDTGDGIIKVPINEIIRRIPIE